MRALKIEDRVFTFKHSPSGPSLQEEESSQASSELSSSEGVFGSRESERNGREKRENWNKSCRVESLKKLGLQNVIRWLIKPYKRCEKPKIPKIYEYIRDKMGIKQNGVVWIKIRGQPIFLCIVNFATIAKITSIAKI